MKKLQLEKSNIPPSIRNSTEIPKIVSIPDPIVGGGTTKMGPSIPGLPFPKTINQRTH